VEKINFKKDNIPFTQVANEVLNDINLTFKAKGLYAFLYSKPEGWDFAIDRIKLQSKEERRAINTGLQELEENGYLLRKRQTSGRVVYILKSQMSKIDIGGLEPNVDFSKVLKQQSAKKDTVSNKDLIVIKSISNKEIYIGEFNNVKLSEEELEKLKDTIPNYLMLIENLSSYMKSKNKRYASHYATILNWNRKNQEEKNKYIKSIKLV